MRRLYFDISDIVSHARKNPRVSGMQRVQARLIGLLAERYGGDVIRCVFPRRRLGRLHECPATGLFGDADFSPGRLLVMLGLRSASAPFEHEVRRHMQRRGRLARVQEGLRLAWLSRFDRSGLAGLGFTLPDRSVRPVSRRPLGRLAPDETLVLPGATWAQPAVRALATRTRRRGGDVVSLIHDVLPAVHPEFFTSGHVRRFARFLKESPGYTSRYACISASTQSQLAAALAARGVTASIELLPLAHEFFGYPRDDRTTRTAAPAVEHAARDPFVLCVGTIEVRKNGANLLRAWLHVQRALGARAPRLVFAGRRGWMIDEFDRLLATEPALAEAVTILDGPTDADLAFLYQRCLFTVFVSYAEGWGLPLGESAWFGRHCIASSTTSMPEVCGPLFEYVTPDDVDEIARAIVRAVRDDDYRTSREQAIRAARLRTWADVVEDLHRIVDRVPEEPATRPARLHGEAGVSAHAPNRAVR